MTEVILEMEECFLFIENIQNLTKFNKIFFVMKYFQNVAFIGNILILMISM
jgi:hypothetical protein